MTPHSAMPIAQPVDCAPFSSRDFRNAMGTFASGVVVITTRTADGEAHAMTANAFMSGSLEPPLVVISVAVAAKMHAHLAEGAGFGVSVLSREQERDSNHFAGRRSADHTPQLVDLHGIPVLAGAAVRLAARQVHAYPCGDHSLFVGHVDTLQAEPADACAPLVYYRGRYGALAS